MLWSVIKIVLFMAVVAVLSLGALILAEQQGMIRLTVFDTEYTLTPLAAVLALLALLILVWLALKALSLAVAVVHFVNGDATAISRYFDRNRERRGYQELADALTALASGEGRTALRLAARAERHLRRPELTSLLTAQAAEAVGDTARASEVYRRLLRDDRTRFVGVRGLMRQKLAEGDTETAFRLAEKAFALKPRHPEVQDTLLRLQSERKDWAGARKTLAQKLRSNGLPRDVYTRRDAVLALAEAGTLRAGGDGSRADALVLQANRMAPDLVPAAAEAARIEAQRGAHRHAAKIVRRAWSSAPHPELAAAFADIAPQETPAARIRRFQPLLQAHPDHPETRALAAELEIAAEDFPAARRALGDLAESHPSTRAMTLMAAIARGEGSPDAVVRGWLARALSAPRGPQWICSLCNHIHAAWVPVCENCHALDTLAWRDPPEAGSARRDGAEMLPLIVGSVEALAVDDADEVAAEPREPADEAVTARDDAAAAGMSDAELSRDADDAVVTEFPSPPDHRRRAG